MIIEQGQFDSYKMTSLNEARSVIDTRTSYMQSRIPVFISHKHDDLNDLKGLIGFLEKNYDVKCYIDSQDPSMPRETSGETARKLKQRINLCNKFILLATNGAISSKWCNWELGYGDAKKYPNDSAILPLRSKGKSDFAGNEYMSIYPSIVYYDGTTRYTSGKVIEKGYYVSKRTDENSVSIEPLGEWLRRKNG